MRPNRNLYGPAGRLWLEREELLVPEFELGRIVGLVEGEGSIYLGRQNKNHDGIARYHPTLDISNTSRALLESIRDRLKIGFLTKGRLAPSTGRQLWLFKVKRSRDLNALLKKILPYLIVKKHVAEGVLAYLEVKDRIKHGDLPYDEGVRTLSLIRDYIVCNNQLKG